MLEKRVHRTREYRAKQVFIIIFSALLIILSYLFENASFLLRAVSTLEFLIFFYLVDHFFEVRFKAKHYIFILIIAVTGFLLSPLYFLSPNYDKVQHFIQPMFMCTIFSYMISKLKIKYKWQIVLAMFVTVAILGLFEIGEFTLDRLFDMKLQGVYLRDNFGFEKFNLLMDPLSDTMADLILGTLGSGLWGLFVYFAYRKKYN